MGKYEEVTWKDWVRTAIAIAVFIGFVIAAAISLPVHWFLLAAAAGLIALINWHTRSFAYRCARCGHEFEISTLKNAVSPHGPGWGGGWKLLRCPECRRWSRARVIKPKRT